MTCPHCNASLPDGTYHCRHCKQNISPAVVAAGGTASMASTADRTSTGGDPTTKKCPFCAEDVQAAAIVCKHCGKDIAPKTAAATLNRPATSFPIVKLIIGVVLLVIIGQCVWRASDPAKSTEQAAQSNTPSASSEPSFELALLSSRGYESDSGGYHYVEGEVKNITPNPIKGLIVVATWRDSGGGLVTSDQGMVEYDPLLPGQSSPFKTITRSNPAMEKYSVAFKTFGGRTFAIDDRREATAADAKAEEQRKRQAAADSAARILAAQARSLVGATQDEVKKRIGEPGEIAGQRWSYTGRKGTLKLYFSSANVVAEVDPPTFLLSTLK